MRSRKFRAFFSGVISFLLVLLLWSSVTYTGFVKDFFLPTPSAVVEGTVNLFLHRAFIIDILMSIERVFVGFSVAVILAVPCGMMIGLNRKVEAFIGPIVAFVRYIPTPALIPLFILWSGIGETEKILAIAQLIFFQLTLMVANSVSFTPKEVIESARTLGATPWQITMHVIFPYIRPRIYDDLRISIGWAWSALMAAEIVGATSGIGLVIIEAQRLLRTQNVIAGILVIGFLGLVTDLVMKRLYPVFFPWAPKLEHHA